MLKFRLIHFLKLSIAGRHSQRVRNRTALTQKKNVVGRLAAAQLQYAKQFLAQQSEHVLPFVTSDLLRFPNEFENDDDPSDEQS
jgi:hypothetical protein